MDSAAGEQTQGGRPTPNHLGGLQWPDLKSRVAEPGGLLPPEPAAIFQSQENPNFIGLFSLVRVDYERNEARN